MRYRIVEYEWRRSLHVVAIFKNNALQRLRMDGSTSSSAFTDHTSRAPSIVCLEPKYDKDLLVNMLGGREAEGYNVISRTIHQA